LFLDEVGGRIHRGLSCPGRGEEWRGRSKGRQRKWLTYGPSDTLIGGDRGNSKNPKRWKDIIREEP